MRKILSSLAATGVMGLALVMGQPQATQASDVAPAVQSGEAAYCWIYDSSWFTYEAARLRAYELNLLGLDTRIAYSGGMYHVFYWL
jgi:hypothetical protein